MGDFTVAGFYSRLPIHRGTKSVAILCKLNRKNKSNTPCYLSGSQLTPISLPIIGTMGDYGTFDDYERSETTKLIEKITGTEFYKVYDVISRTNEYYPTISERIDHAKQYNDCNNEIDTLEKVKLLYNIYKIDAEKQEPVFVVIHEHYSVYKAICGDSCTDIMKSINKLIKVIDKANKYIKDNNIDIVTTRIRNRSNIFETMFGNGLPGCPDYANVMTSVLRMQNITEEQANNLIDGYDKILQEFYKPLNKHKYNKYRIPAEYIYNYVTSMEYRWFMGIYSLSDYNLKKMKNDVAEWCSFIQVYDSINGLFCYSSYAGQNWHHDKDYTDLLKNIYTTYNNIIDKYIEDDEDEYDEQYDENIE